MSKNKHVSKNMAEQMNALKIDTTNALMSAVDTAGDDIVELCSKNKLDTSSIGIVLAALVSSVIDYNNNCIMAAMELAKESEANAIAIPSAYLDLEEGTVQGSYVCGIYESLSRSKKEMDDNIKAEFMAAFAAV